MSTVVLHSDWEKECPRCDSTEYRKEFPADNGEFPSYTCETCGEEWAVIPKRVPRAFMLQWRPMKAAGWNGKDDYTGPDYVQEVKLNGDRLLAVITPTTAQFFTRTLSRGDGLPVEKTDWLPHLSKLRSDDVLILDGEIVCPGRTDHTLVAERFGCAAATSISRQFAHGLLDYVVFDVLAWGDDLREQPLRERLEARREVCAALQKQLTQQHRFRRLHLYEVPSGTGKNFLQDVLKQGGEGIIAKRLDAKYFPDGRPAGVWIKRKAELELDLFIVGYKEAKAETVKKGDAHVSAAKYAGLIGSVELAVMRDGEPVSICYSSGIPDALRKLISHNRSGYLRRVVRVTCQSVMTANDGTISLQNPRITGWREDKQDTECLYEDIA